MQVECSLRVGLRRGWLGRGKGGDLMVTKRVRVKKLRWLGEVVNGERYDGECETGRRKSGRGRGGTDE